MANPSAPQEGSANTRRLPYLIDPDNPGEAYLPVGSGALDMGAGRTPGGIQGALPWGLGSDGVPLQHHVADTFRPFALSTVTTEQSVWNPAGGKKVRLLGGTLTANAATTIAILDGTGGATILILGAPADVPVPFDLGAIGILSGVADNELFVTSTDSADIAGTVWGCEE